MGLIIIAASGAVALVVIGIATRRAAPGWWRRSAALWLGVVLLVLGALSQYGRGGKPWPRGPEIGESTQAYMVLGGLLSAIAGMVLVGPRRSDFVRR